jgi:hypothetical protein
VLGIWDFSDIIVRAGLVPARDNGEMNSALVQKMDQATMLCLRSPSAGRSKSGCRCDIPDP